MTMLKRGSFWHRVRVALVSVALGALGCGGGGGTPTISVAPAAAALAPQGTQRFSASVTGASDARVAWSVDESVGGTVDDGGQYTAPGAGGTYHVRASLRASPKLSAAATVTVSAPQGAPTIASFTATPATIAAGQSSTLSWSVTDASTLTIDQGVGGVTGSTSRLVSPTATTTYTLSASNAAGSATATATATVTASPGASPSCVGLPATCGGSKDCCASNVVAGGAFNRSDDPSFPATVSAFKLDVYEVTVGRFRAFVNAGMGTQAKPPAAGDGAHPKIASSGWDPAFNASLPADTDALKAELKCNGAYPAWSDAPSGKETNPINCVSWFEAFAFCAWEGGRLPTEAEWNYAAAGGGEQRAYPWGASIDATKASYNCSGRGPGTCVFSDMRPVGSFSPQGDGKWGQADLAGNVWEYTLDYSAEPYRLTTCRDCADLQPAPYRTFRGGGFANEWFYEVTSTRLSRSPGIADYDVGVRCARDR